MHRTVNRGTSPAEVKALPTGSPDLPDARIPAREASSIAPNGSRPWSNSARVAALAASDALALLLAGTVAFLLWAGPVRNQDPSLYLSLAPGVTLILLGYGQAGLYPGFGLGPVEVIRRYFLVTVTAFLVMAALVFGLKLEDQYSRVTLVLGFALSLVFIAVFRWLVTRVLSRRPWWPEPVVLLGNGTRTELALSALDQGSSREFRVVGSLGGNDERTTGGDSEGSGLPSSQRTTDWEGLLAEGEAYAGAGVQIAFADLNGPGSDEALDRLRLVFPRVMILREFADLPVEGVQVRNLGGVLGLEYGNNLLQGQSRWVKRALDLAIALPVLVLSLPVMLVAMVAVRLLSPGPALFWHEREGRRGRSIRVPKIRTMVLDAEERMEQLLREDAAAREEWEAGFKLRSDPRVIPWIGRILRRTSIDELPQLWSVLKGDRSLVGPRPFPAYHLDALSERARRLRGEVRPGISGLWQVAARGEADVAVQQSYDVYYIRNWSIWLDLYILSRTVSAVVTGRGAY
jgi:Undecaprenyl-phosphate galactose phosphotransferase WbaP